MRPVDQDLTIDSVLRDPLIRAVMAADRIAPPDFERLLRLAAAAMDARPTMPAPVSSAPRAQQGRGLLPRLCFA